MKPTDYFEWSGRDRGLAEALLAMEDSTGSHGIPYDEAFDPENDGWFEVKTRTDVAQAALDRWREDEGSKADPGTVPYVVNARPSASGEEPLAADGPEDPGAERAD